MPPIFWSVGGGSAALLFGMTPDLMLFVAGATLAFYGVGTRRPRLFDVIVSLTTWTGRVRTASCRPFRSSTQAT